MCTLRALIVYRGFGHLRPNDHWQEGEVGEALRERKLNSRACHQQSHLLHALWRRSQRRSQWNHHEHGPIPKDALSFVVIVPTVQHASTAIKVFGPKEHRWHLQRGTRQTQPVDIASQSNGSRLPRVWSDSAWAQGWDIWHHEKRGEATEAIDHGGLEQGGVQGGALLLGAPEPALQLARSQQ